MTRPLVALTMGDPAGIGPEVILKAAIRADIRSRCRLVVFGDAGWLAMNQKRLPRSSPARRLVIAAINGISAADLAPSTALPVVDLENVDAGKVRFGRSGAAGGRASGEYIASAILAARKGEVDAVVTAPINKVSFALGGWGRKFVGHTEMFASLTGAKNARLMLVHHALRAVHVTSHIPLRDVPRALTRAKIADTIRTTHAGLKALGIRSPRIAVCGLNPHAGDDGVLGNEEKNTIAPAVAAARRSGIRAEGPLSADVVWPMILSGRFDAGVAMYHDQGQIAIKLQGTGDAVNVTLGLPIVRTSPAHGTAYDIAGRGRASEESMAAAIRMAADMARQP